MKPEPQEDMVTTIQNAETRQQQRQLAGLVAQYPDELLDLDVLGLTPRRVPSEQPPRNPDYATLPVPRSQYVSKAAQLPSAPDRASFTVGDPGGLLEEGNIDLGARKRVDNGDGTFSTVVSKSFEEDGFEVLIPTLDPDGNPLSDEEAVARYKETGEHLGKFDTPDSATAYAIRLSERQDPALPRDPDAYIDLGSERWRDVFIKAPAMAAAANRKRSFDKENPPRPKPKPRPKGYRQTPNVSPDIIKQFKERFQAPVFQPTKARDGSK